LIPKIYKVLFFSSSSLFISPKFNFFFFFFFFEFKKKTVLLQGSVRLQVNAGPLEIVNTFLSPEKVGKYDEALINQLKNHFKEFLQTCYNALSTNRGFNFLFFLFQFLFFFFQFFFFPIISLVKPDQRAYQDDLEEGFEDLKKKLLPFITDGNATDIFFYFFFFFSIFFLLLNFFQINKSGSSHKTGDKDVLSFISGVEEDKK